ncbi:MAG TPA: hypothetical protein VFE62_07505 [Gemmataceae bacterium]|nr:hypothetical protein [Gemmataceae bacterium]
MKTKADRIARINAAAGGGLATFQGLAYTGAPMTPSGWRERVIVDLKGVSYRPDNHHPALHLHNPLKIVGHTTSVRIDKAGIHVAGVFSGHPTDRNAIIEPAKGGFKWQMSIGADPVDAERLDAREEAEVNGLMVTGPLVIVRRTVLGEVSFVPLGADGATSVSVNASHRERLLASAGPCRGTRRSATVKAKPAKRRAAIVPGIRCLLTPYNRLIYANNPRSWMMSHWPHVIDPNAYTESLRDIAAGRHQCYAFFGGHHRDGTAIGDVNEFFRFSNEADGLYVEIRRRPNLMAALREFPSLRALSISEAPTDTEVFGYSKTDRPYYIVKRAIIDHVAIVENPGVEAARFTL